MVANELSDAAGLDVCCMEVLGMSQITGTEKKKHDWGGGEYSRICCYSRCVPEVALFLTQF